jgi:hypothetical protein
MRRTSFSIILAVVLSASIAAITGCDDAADGTGGNTTTSSTTGSGGGIKATITSKGGEVKSADGDVTMTFPAGSAPNGTEVTLTIHPKTADTATDIYEFTPKGLTLEIPAKLVIDIFDVTPPMGKTYALATETGSTWTVVPGTTFGSGTINADVPKLDTFAVVFVDSGPCDAGCMAQAGAVCCTGCGCMGAVQCMPQCELPLKWDCEMECCFDYDALKCAP